MRTHGASAANINMAVSALRFFFSVTLERGEAAVGMATVRLPQRLPVILSPEEVSRLLDHAPGLKARAALSLAYGAGSLPRALLRQLTGEHCAARAGPSRGLRGQAPHRAKVVHFCAATWPVFTPPLTGY